MNLWNYRFSVKTISSLGACGNLMSHAIQIRRTGGPEVVNWTTIEASEPSSGKMRLRQAASATSGSAVLTSQIRIHRSLP